MNIEKLFNDFLYLEKRHDLFNKFSENVPLWNLIRFYIWAEIITVKKLNHKEISTDYKTIKFIEKLKVLANLILGSLFRNPFINLNKNDILFIDSDRYEQVSGKYFDIYMDYIIGSLNNYKSLKIIRSYGKFYNPLYFNNTRFFDAVNILTEVKRNFSKIDKNILNEIKSILKIFAEYMNLDINIEKEARKIYKTKIVNFFEYKRAFKKILKKVKPKIVISNSHYGSKSIAANIVSYKMNIPTVELQHGTINRFHIGYNYSNLKKNSFHAPLPQYILLFGNYWQDKCKLPIPDKNKIPVGFPHLELKKNAIIKKTQKKKQILIISQRTIGHRLKVFAENLANLIPEEYKIIYKLHPKEYDVREKRYKELIKYRNIQVTSAYDTKNLYEYFAESELLIGVYSTAIYEGLAFNLKAFIVKIDGYEYMLDLINSSNVQLVESTNQVIKFLKNRNISKQDKDLNSEVWKNNSVENMKKEIRKTITRYEK